jgi:hypothetical protein
MNLHDLLAALDGSNKLQFYFIDLFDVVIRSLQDPTLEGKVYHSFRMELNQGGLRVFEKANSGLVFESFYCPDVEIAPGIVIVASDASPQGHMTQHPLYCKYELFLLMYC